MKKSHVIKLEHKARILERAKKYVESVESCLDDGDQGVALLLRAMKHADTALKRESMFVLGTFAKEEVAWPLYDLMTDPLALPDVAADAASQVSVISPSLIKPQPL